MKILIVDDSEIMRSFIKECIENWGGDIIGEACDGAQGVQMYKELKPDLVMLDITMPKVHGLQCLKSILDSDKNAKIIICSAIGQRDIIMKALKTGAFDYIIKPFDEETLQQKLNKVQKLINDTSST